MKILAALFVLLWSQEKPTEVVFVGTQHFISDAPEGYTPAHLRVLLAKINPSVLTVEAPTNVKNPWDFAPLELQWVTKPWAEEQKVPLLPIGWNDPFYMAKVQTMATANLDEFQKLEARFQGELSARVTCEELNGEKGIDLWRQYHHGLHDLLGKETPWEAWNAKILENLRTVVRDNRGKRVAIVFGAAHGYYLIDGLSKAEGVRVLPCSSFFPLPAEEIRSRTTPKDHLLALRPLNFGFVPAEKQAALGRHLDALKEVPEYRGDYDLFAGKFQLAKGEFEGAGSAFAKVSSLGDDQVSRFDGATRLNEAGGLFAGIALARQGRRVEARDRIKSLLQKAGLSAPMRQAAEQLLKELGPE